jgi:putative DNA primase/helicase
MSDVISLAAAAEARAVAAVDSRQPMQVAREFQRRARAGAWDTLLNVGGEFLEWNGTTHYERVELALLWRRVYALLAALGGKATRHAVLDVMHALQAETFARGAPPFWREGAEGPACDELVPLANGVLDPSTRTLIPHSPALVATAVAPVTYDPTAQCPAFVEFIEGAVPDAESRAMLKRFFGLLVGSRSTRYQRILALIGATRSGKGVLLRLLRRLVGEDQVAAPMLQTLGTRFGLASLVGKSVGLISDARVPSGPDAAAAIEVLLRLSGEDAVTIERKFGEAWSARLPIRLVLASNEVPMLADSSSALAGRIIIIRTGPSHHGREDHTLEDRLHAELPGILNWCLDGLDELRSVGRLDQPADGAGLVEILRDSGSPIGQFLRERCVLDPAAEKLLKSDLFATWRDWCALVNRSHPGNEAQFARALVAAAPSVQHTKPWIGPKRFPCWNGIRLRNSTDE